jgi:hypothetical protein
MLGVAVTFVSAALLTFSGALMPFLSSEARGVIADIPRLPFALVLGAISVLIFLCGRDFARRKGWNAYGCIAIIGVLFALFVSFPRSRFHPIPFDRDFVSGAFVTLLSVIPPALLGQLTANRALSRPRADDESSRS